MNARIPEGRAAVLIPSAESADRDILQKHDPIGTLLVR